VIHGKQLAIVLGLKLISPDGDVEREDLRLGIGELRIVELPAISAPDRICSAILGDLPSAVAAGERSDINLLAAGVGGTKG